MIYEVKTNCCRDCRYFHLYTVIDDEFNESEIRFLCTHSNGPKIIEDKKIVDPYCPVEKIITIFDKIIEIIETEPELPGEAPDEFEDHEEILRSAVRVTKKCILDKIKIYRHKQMLSEGKYGERSKN